ncbi:unnamed protein product [Phytophthora fragariaefolia]|uniref:Unnamed protein product n=1 Tax=Phytophthora fragariaefolia TaxID=1490495 RepID=A0A9W6UEL8_9STRA|nr:unnamed protein product [Phytophthora fragariaefolia]
MEEWNESNLRGSHATSDCHALKNKGKAEHKRAEAKPKRAREGKARYPRIHNDSQAELDSDASGESSSEDDELKFFGLVEKKPRPTGAPLRITVKLRRSGTKVEVLLDSGASKSIINRKTLAANMQTGRKFIPASPIVFKTMNGSVTSSGSTVAQFVFAQLKPETMITHRFEVIEDSSDEWTVASASTPAMVPRLTDQQQDSEFPEETKEAGDNAVEPEQLLPGQLEGALAQQYLALLVKHRARYDGHLGQMRFPDYELPLSPDYKPVYAKPDAIPEALKTRQRRRYSDSLTKMCWDKSTIRRWNHRRSFWSNPMARSAC